MTHTHIIYPLCAHHLRPSKRLSNFCGILPELPIIGQCRPCFVPATDLRDQVGPEKNQVLKSLVWSQPNFLNIYFDQPSISQIPQKKNDLINSRSALPKTWSFSGYPHTRAGIMYPLYPHSIILYYINRFKPPWLNHFSAFSIFACTPKWGFRKIGVHTHRSIFWDFHCKS